MILKLDPSPHMSFHIPAAPAPTPIATNVDLLKILRHCPNVGKVHAGTGLVASRYRVAAFIMSSIEVQHAHGVDDWQAQFWYKGLSTSNS